MKPISCLLLMAVLALSACASYEPSSAPVAKPAELKFSSANGTRAGAQPYTDKELQAATFDADLDESDVIAIQVMVENKRQAPVIVRSSDTRLEMPNGQTIAPSGVSRTVGRIDEDGSVVGAGIAFGIIGVMVASGEENEAKEARRIDYEARSLKDPSAGESWWIELPLTGISYEPSEED